MWAGAHTSTLQTEIHGTARPRSFQRHPLQNLTQHAPWSCGPVIVPPFHWTNPSPPNLSSYSPFLPPSRAHMRLQARATLEATLGLQLSNMRAALGRLRQQVAAADAALGGMARALVEAGEGDSAESAARPAEAGTAEAGAAGAEAGVAAGEGAGTEAAVAAARGADAGRTAAPDAMEEF